MWKQQQNNMHVTKPPKAIWTPQWPTVDAEVTHEIAKVEEQAYC